MSDYISLSPSSASRWMTCTASPGYCSRNKDRLKKKGSYEAGEGDLAHKHVEAVVNTVIDMEVTVEEALEFLDLKDIQEYNKNGLDVEKLEELWKKEIGDSATFFLEKAEGADVTIEAKLPIWYKEDQNGYVDYLFLRPEQLTIWDFKFGQGDKVYARNNLQMSAYAISVYEAYGDVYGWTPQTPITLGIYQPRIWGDKKYELWVTTVEDLQRFTEKMASTAKEIVENPAGGVFRPSSKACKYCPAREFCVPKNKGLTEALPMDVELFELDTIQEAEEANALAEYAADSLPLIEALTPEQIGAVLRVAGDITKWINQLKEYAKDQLEQGNPLPGYKLVNGNGSRKWKDPVEAERLLRSKLKKDGAFKSTLLSVSQAETALKAVKTTTRFDNLLSAQIIKTQGKPTVAKDSDKRPAITPQSIGFENLDSEGEKQPENATTIQQNDKP